jgi:hypothetical protein
MSELDPQFPSTETALVLVAETVDEVFEDDDDVLDPQVPKALWHPVPQ